MKWASLIGSACAAEIAASANAVECFSRRAAADAAAELAAVEIRRSCMKTICCDAFLPFLPFLLLEIGLACWEIERRNGFCSWKTTNTIGVLEVAPFPAADGRVDLLPSTLWRRLRENREALQKRFRRNCRRWSWMKIRRVWRQIWPHFLASL